MIYSVGAPVQSKPPASPGEATLDTIVMPASEFQQTGRVIGFEFYAEVTGNVLFLVGVLQSLELFDCFFLRNFVSVLKFACF